MNRRELLDCAEWLLEVINSLLSKGLTVEEKGELEELAGELDVKQNELAHAIIRENDEKYLALVERLMEVNSAIKKDLTEFETVRKSIDGVKQGVAAITDIVKLGAALA